ncbi:MAG: aromatic ring-hydroxylating oxygenase subunit alpha [Gammaproteobacteria bacterium]
MKIRYNFTSPVQGRRNSVDQIEQVVLGETLLDYVERGATATCESIYRQPVGEYICADQAAAEKRAFFRQQMLCIGLSARLPERGTFFTDDLSGVPILMTRDAEGDVHAFLNVCRHRGSNVAQNCGSARAFVCPYHAWTYNLKGELVARPEDAAFAGADRDTHGLTELTTAEHNGMLWVCPTPNLDIDLEEQLAGLSPELAAYKLDTFHHFDSCIIQRRMNWKLIVDTFLESYHFCVLHKDTICSIFYDNLTAFDNWGSNFRIVSARRTIEALKQQPHSEWNIMPHIVGIYVLFPNTVLVWQLDHIELWHIYPYGDNPDESILRLDLYTPEPAVDKKSRQYWQKNLDLVVKVVQEEDFPVGETIQHGFHSDAQDHILFGTNEPALSFFHHAITQSIKAARR